MATYLVLGAGMMGSALAYDLCRFDSSGTRVVLADASDARLESARRLAGNGSVETVRSDFDDAARLRKLIAECDCVLGAASYRYNELITGLAIEAGVPFCDLGGNDGVVSRQHLRHDEARRRGVLVLPNCGLAPGLAPILAAGSVKEFDSVQTVAMRVGGLPQHPVPPLNYQIVFSVEGLINEYSGMCAVIRGGRLSAEPALSGLETLEFRAPFGTVEAFHTSGGASRLPELLAGRVDALDYKTIRYPGHCERFKTLLELGFASDEPIAAGASLMTSKEVFFELLRRKIPSTGPDLVLMRVTTTGVKNGRPARLVFETVDFFDFECNISSMMRMTAFPTAIIARMILRGDVDAAGVMGPEECIPVRPLVAELARRSIVITEQWEEPA